jgi:SAM-dependent methyltransferase
MIVQNINEKQRQAWLKDILNAIPKNSRILDAGAGELRNRKFCAHLNYISQDFCQYHGSSGFQEGLQTEKWDTSKIDLISDITKIPEADSSFDVILCSEVLEHVPEPTDVLDEFFRLLKPGGQLIITAPFASIVHMAPYYYCSGFSKYWYQHNLQNRGFEIQSLISNGDWFAVLRQEITRLGSIERKSGNWTWILAYAYAALGLIYFKIRANVKNDDLSCFGWHCLAMKSHPKDSD